MFLFRTKLQQEYSDLLIEAAKRILENVDKSQQTVDGEKLTEALKNLSSAIVILDKMKMDRKQHKFHRYYVNLVFISYELEAIVINKYKSTKNELSEIGNKLIDYKEKFKNLSKIY